jgi:hypothetical protein
MILKEKGSERIINCPLSTTGIVLSTAGMLFQAICAHDFPLTIQNIIAMSLFKLFIKYISNKRLLLKI